MGMFPFIPAEEPNMHLLEFEEHNGLVSDSLRKKI